MNERLIGLLSADYVLTWARLCRGLFGGDLLKTMVFATVTQANTAHLDHRRETSAAWGSAWRPPPNHLRRRITPYAVATALGVSRETLRRKVKALTTEGYLAEDIGGVYVPAESTITSQTLAVLQANTALARAFYLQLRAAGLGPRVRDVAGTPGEERLDRAIGRLTNTFCLRFLDNLAGLGGGDITLGVAICGLTTSSTRHLLHQPEGFPPGRAAPLPEALLRPVTAMTLSRELAIPRETARRRLHWWVDRGVVRAVPGGFLLREAEIDWGPVATLHARTAANARQLEISLRPTGILLPDT